MKRPADIAQILSVVETLATYGVVRPVGEFDPWLKGIGVVAENPQSSLLVPTNLWLSHAVPSVNHRDLLRKTALCDHLYRQYLDVTIASILHMIAKTERWGRFEELIFGQFRSFTPRFVQLLTGLSQLLDKDSKQVIDNDWLSVVSDEMLQHKDTFNQWNACLWGTAETPSALFPLLGDLYIPLLDVPIHFSCMQSNVDDTQKRLLCSLIRSSQHSEGIIVEDNEKDCLISMLKNGLPVRVWPSGQQLKAGIIGNVTVTVPASSDMKTTEPTQLPVTMPTVKAAIRESGSDCQDTSTDLWSIRDKCSNTYVYYALDLRSNKWPDDFPPEIPEKYAVPPLNLLRDAGKSRSVSPHVDTALQWLGDHPLYGFLLQLFLLEALDRELGDETLVLVPGASRDENNWCDEATTRLVYKPRTQGTGSTEIHFPSYDLGMIDAVMTPLSRSFGIDRIVHPYALEGCGTWSTAFQLFRQADIISDRYNRWSLAEHILDRLYGGGLMTSVIRKGKEVRETLHIILKEIWDEKERLQKKREVHSE